MAFGKAVFAKPLNLGKAAFGKFGGIAAFQHARVKAVAKGADRAHPPKRREGSAQTVRLFGGKACRDHGDLHCLFLKQRHAHGFAQHLLQRLGRKADRLFALTAVDIGMHHAALNGTGAHDGHLYHQIIENPGLHPGQEIHLRAAFNLKHPDGIGLTQHVIGGRIRLRYGSNRQGRPTIFSDQIKAFANAGQHAKAKDVDLQNAQGVDIILVPFDGGAVVHRGVFNRAHLIQPSARDDEPADMLA